MTMKTYTSSSTVKPPAWDTESSKVVVYHNYNIREIPATEEIPLMYAYDVDEYTKQEYKDEIEPQYARAAMILLGEV